MYQAKLIPWIEILIHLIQPAKLLNKSRLIQLFNKYMRQWKLARFNRLIEFIKLIKLDFRQQIYFMKTR